MDKIKVTLSTKTNDILLSDCELFEFFKEDYSLNKNKFLNQLVLNYYEEFSNSQFDLFNNVDTLLKENNIKKDYLPKELIDLIINSINKEENYKSTTISFKPTKNSIDVIAYIENKIIQNDTISSFYRSLFDSYCSLPRNKREQIIFKDSINVINQAIKKKKRIFFTTNNSEIIKEVSVYSLCSSKDELFNYIVVLEKNRRMSYRLSRLNGVKLLSIDSEDFTNHKVLLDKQIKYAPQYVIGENDTELIQIKLTKKGESLYRKIYLFRPPFIKKENNIYTFDCAYVHIIFYFSRFGQDAIVISPSSLKRSLLGYYKYSFLAFKNEN